MKQYHIISTPEGKMLRPVKAFGDAPTDEVLQFRMSNPDLPYLGNREPGTVVSEGEIERITQYKLGGEWRLLVEGSEFAHYWELETRVAYTDAIPDEGYPGIDYQPLFNHMSKQHGLTLTTSEMDEIIGLSTYILAKK